MRVDIMTDIETLGRNNDSVIFQIAACAFDISTGDIIDTFNEKVNVKTVENGRFDGSTLVWWLNTNKELLTKLLNSGQWTEKELFEHFYDWIGNFHYEHGFENVFLWGNGILFDNKLIQAKMKNYGLRYPVFYRNDRDMRTIVELAALKTGFSTEKEFRESHKKAEYTEHDGFDDVKAQIDVLSMAWNILLNK